jgi:hypothetical protein
MADILSNGIVAPISQQTPLRNNKGFLAKQTNPHARGWHNEE